MKTEKHKIRLEITPNSHRLIIAFGDKVKLFCSAKFSIVENTLVMPPLKITFVYKQSSDYSQQPAKYVFWITPDDAARLLTRLARPAYGASISFAEPHIMAKWETRVTFTAKDFE